MSMAIQRFTLATLLLFSAAFWTPWWGTILVTFTMASLSGFRTKLLALASFAGWLMALVVRDYLNDQGPSRTLVRMFSLTDLGNAVAQPAVLAAIAVLGACIGGSTAGVVNSIKDWRQNS